MVTVSSSEAKSHFSQLLDRVASGEEVIITKRGTPVARLVPIEAAHYDVAQVIQRMREFSEGITLGGLTISSMREEGRRY